MNVGTFPTGGGGLTHQEIREQSTTLDLTINPNLFDQSAIDDDDSLPQSRIVSPSSSNENGDHIGSLLSDRPGPGANNASPIDCPRSASQRRPKRSLMSALSFDTGSSVRTSRHASSGGSPCTETFSLRRLSTVSSQRIRSSFSKSGLFRRKSSAHSIAEAINKNREKKLAYVSLYIVWLFIFCHVWKLIPTGYEILMAKDDIGLEIDTWPGWLDMIEKVSHTLITLNSTLNFFVYLVL